MFDFFRRKSKPDTSLDKIRPRQLQQRLDNGEKFILLDVRSQPEFERDGRLINSRSIPLPELSNRHNELPKDQPIICICRSGARSRMACGQLATLGHSKIINLQGGMIAWKLSRLPFE